MVSFRNLQNNDIPTNDLIVKSKIDRHYDKTIQLAADKAYKVANADLAHTDLSSLGSKKSLDEIKQAIGQSNKYNHDMSNTLVLKMKGREVKFNFVTEQSHAKTTRHREEGGGFAHIEGNNVRMRRSVAERMQVGPTMRVRERELNVEIMDDAEADAFEEAIGAYIQQQSKEHHSEEHHEKTKSHSHRPSHAQAPDRSAGKESSDAKHKISSKDKSTHQNRVDNEIRIEHKKQKAKIENIEEKKFEKTEHRLKKIIKDQSIDFEGHKDVGRKSIGPHKVSDMHVDH